MTINAKILPNGNLKLTANNESRADMGRFPENTVADELHEQFEFIRPEQIGALTDSPILADFDGLEYDDGKLLACGDVWWFPDYWRVDPWEELRCKGRVIFTAAPNNNREPIDAAMRHEMEQEQITQEWEMKNAIFY